MSSESATSMTATSICSELPAPTPCGRRVRKRSRGKPWRECLHVHLVDESKLFEANGAVEDHAFAYTRRSTACGERSTPASRFSTHNASRRPMSKTDFNGYWRITHTDGWGQEALDLIRPAHLRFSGRSGSLLMIAIEASLDCRYEKGRVDFSLFGTDELDPIAGRGWATIDEAGNMEGMLYLHDGDETEFTAEKAEAPAEPERQPTRRRGRR